MIKERIIKKILDNNQSITIEKYIEFCLYDNHGYYTNNNIVGKSGDFITAPEISQLFGEIIGLSIYSLWKNTINQSFNLIELGPGKGTLLIDILNITKKFPKFQKSLNIKLIEINDDLIKQQKYNLKTNVLHTKNIKWVKDLTSLSPNPAIIYANEFLDCLPIGQFHHNNGTWVEKMVNFNKEDEAFFTENKIIQDPATLSFLNKQDHNNILEISEKRDNYFHQICKYLRKFGGVSLIIDYGYYDNPNNFTLQSISNHQRTNIFDNPGTQDITSLVNFKRLIEIAKWHNLNIYTFCSQKEFLLSHGIEKRKNIILKKCNNKQKDIIEKGYERLIDEKNMGSLFKVLIVTR